MFNWFQFACSSQRRQHRSFLHGAIRQQKSELSHRVISRGRVIFITYYFCSLAVLPSHILGTSRWISRNAISIPTGEKNRRFRNFYQCGWLQVETYDVFVGGCHYWKGPEVSILRIHGFPSIPFASGVSSSGAFDCVWLAIIQHVMYRNVLTIYLGSVMVLWGGGGLLMHL